MLTAKELTAKLANDLSKITQRIRYLRSVLSEIEYYVKNDPVDAMLRDGIISKNDLNMMKCIAKAENFDTSKIEFPEE